jgi:hypothetical protein
LRTVGHGALNLHYLDKYHRRTVAVGLPNRLSATASVKWAGRLEVAGRAAQIAVAIGRPTQQAKARTGLAYPSLDRKLPRSKCYRISESSRLTCRKRTHGPHGRIDLPSGGVGQLAAVSLLYPSESGVLGRGCRRGQGCASLRPKPARDHTMTDKPRPIRRGSFLGCVLGHVAGG